MLHCVHSSLIYNSKKLERTQMPLNGGMDTEIVVEIPSDSFKLHWMLTSTIS